MLTMADKRGGGVWTQSCKNLGSVVALLQGNFKKIMNLRQFWREKTKNPKMLGLTNNFYGQN